eukprot:GEMP01002576.1.p1 GENE.GEMP01002576.1~~GEMP01002576.1.p1  ORF type:complete len:1269 (+),score=249.05 GEMP01002576.1:111-3917(+)
MATKMKARNKISASPQGQNKISQPSPVRGACNVPLSTMSTMIQPMTSSELLNSVERSENLPVHDSRTANPTTPERPTDPSLDGFINVMPPENDGAGVDIAAIPTPQKKKANKINPGGLAAAPNFNAGTATLTQELLLRGSIYGTNSPNYAQAMITAEFSPPSSMRQCDLDDVMKDSLLLSNRTIPPPLKQFEWGSASLERACSAENIRDILGVHSDGSLSGMEYSDQYSDQGDKKEALLRKEVEALKRRKTGLGKKILRRLGLMKRKKSVKFSAMGDVNKVNNRPMSADDLMWLRKSTVMSLDGESDAQLLWCRDTDESDSDYETCRRTMISPPHDGALPRGNAARDGSLRNTDNAPPYNGRSMGRPHICNQDTRTTTQNTVTKENDQRDSKSGNKPNESSEIEYHDEEKDAEEKKDEEEEVKSGAAKEQREGSKKKSNKEESEMEYRFSSSSSTDAAVKVRFDVPPIPCAAGTEDDCSTKEISSTGRGCQRAPLSDAEKPEPHGLPYIVVAHQGCSLRDNCTDTEVADWVDYGEIVWAVNRRRAKIDGKSASWYYIQIDVEGGPSWVSQCDPSTNSALLSPVRITSASKSGHKSFVTTRSLKTRSAPVHPPSKGKSRRLYAGYVLKPRALARVKCEDGDLRFLQHPDGSWLLESANSTDLLVEIKTTKLNKEYVTNAKCPLMPGPCAGKTTNTLEEGTIVHATSMCKPTNSQGEDGTYVYLVEDSSKLSKPIGWAKLEHLSQMTVSDHQACYVVVAKNVHLLDSPSKLPNHETPTFFKVSDRLDMLRKVQVHIQVPYYETLVYFELISGGFVALKNAKTDKVQLEFERYNPPSTKNVSRRFPYPLPDAAFVHRKQSPLSRQRGAPTPPTFAPPTSGQSDQSNSSGEYPAPAAPTTRHDHPSYGPPAHNTNTARNKSARPTEPAGRSPIRSPDACSPRQYSRSPTGRGQPRSPRNGAPCGISRPGPERYPLHRQYGAPNNAPPMVSPVRNRPHPNSSENVAGYPGTTHEYPSYPSQHSAVGHPNANSRRGGARAMTMDSVRSAPPQVWSMGVQGQHPDRCDTMHPGGYSHYPHPVGEHPALHGYHRSYPGWRVPPAFNETTSHSSVPPQPTSQGNYVAGSPYPAVPIGTHYTGTSAGTQYAATHSRAQYGAIPAGTQHAVTPTGAQYGPMSAGTQYTVPPTGTQNAVTPNGAQYGSMPAGTQHPVTPNGAQYGSVPVGMRYPTAPTVTQYGPIVAGTQCETLSAPSSSPDGFVVEKKTTTQQAFFNYR